MSKMSRSRRSLKAVLAAASVLCAAVTASAQEPEKVIALNALIKDMFMCESRSGAEQLGQTIDISGKGSLRLANKLHCHEQESSFVANITRIDELSVGNLRIPLFRIDVQSGPETGRQYFVIGTPMQVLRG
jgi:ABC-type sugar transport system substrate-binding protein